MEMPEVQLKMPLASYVRCNYESYAPSYTSAGNRPGDETHGERRAPEGQVLYETGGMAARTAVVA